MNEQKAPKGIEWTRVWGRKGYTWNPIRGCIHECIFDMPDGGRAICYAKSMALVIKQSTRGKAYQYGFEHITYHEKELRKPSNKKTPSGIFVCSMSDLFGHSVDSDWIEKVIRVMQSNPQHIFFTLTKNHIGMKPYQDKLPKNVWVGISPPPQSMYGNELSDNQQIALWEKSLDTLSTMNVSVKWLSLEPLTWSINTDLGLQMFNVLEQYIHEIDWVVLGAASHKGMKYQPNTETFKQVLDTIQSHEIPVFFKGNIDPLLGLWGAGQWMEQFPDETKFNHLKPLTQRTLL